MRDVDILKKLKNCSVGFTVTTPDDKTASVLEPGAALPSARLLAAKRFVAEGLNVWAFIAPVLPGITDAPGVLEKLIIALKVAGVKEVYLDSLNSYPASVERLKVAYRAKFLLALKCLQQYLSDPCGYLRALSGELAALSEKYGFDLKFD